MGLARTIVRHVIEGDGSAKLHRRIIIHGTVGIDWSLDPCLTLNRVIVADPAWAQGPMVTMRQLRVRIALLPLLHGRVVLPSLALRRPVIHLDTPSPTRPNWVFVTPRPRTPRPQLRVAPRIGRLVITHGHITVHDAPAATDLV
jgi:hypothetical protein